MESNSPSIFSENPYLVFVRADSRNSFLHNAFRSPCFVTNPPLVLEGKIYSYLVVLMAGLLHLTLAHTRGILGA